MNDDTYIVGFMLAGLGVIGAASIIFVTYRVISNLWRAVRKIAPSPLEK